MIFAAGLDVTDPEPPAAGRPAAAAAELASSRRTSPAPRSARRNAMAEIAADNLIAGVRGEPLPAWVNPEVAERHRK